MGEDQEHLPYQPYQSFNLHTSMASSSPQQHINGNSSYDPPKRSQSLYLQQSGLDEPEILKRRARSTRGRRSRKSTLFSSRSIPKIPQVENSVDLFEKVLSALKNCAQNLRDNIRSSPVTAKRSLESKLRWCEDRLSQIEGLYEFYKHEIRMRQGARNLESALTSYGVKHGQDKCKSNYKEHTQNMCEIEDEFERRIGRFKVKIDGLDGFARLCPGDNFEIFVRNGIGRKWKAKCKIERDGQKWVDNDIEIKGSVKDGLFLRIIEVKKIQANAQIGSFSVRLRNYISAHPMNLSIPVNKIGNLKLRIVVHWQPLSSKEEMKIKKTNRESLLSEVFFGAAVSISHEEPPRISVASPPGFSPSSPSSNNSSSATNSPTFNFKSVAYENHRDRNKSSTSTEPMNEEAPGQESSASDREHTSEVSTAEEDINMEGLPSQPSTLGHLIRRLQSALTEHKDQYPQLQQLYGKLEKLDEVLQVGKLRKSNLTGSVESALESFSFLDLTEVGVKPSKDIRPNDTGYSSTEETQKLDQGQASGESSENVSPELPSAPTKVAPDEVSSFNSYRDSDLDSQSHSSDLGSTGSSIIDKVLKQHLKFCLRLTEDLGSIGPLKCKETSAIIKLEWQCGILETLTELTNAKQPPQTISKAYSPLAASGHDEILLFWAGNCGENPLFIHCDDFQQALKNQFHSEISEGYSRVAEKLYPVIATRILTENDTLLTPNIDADSIISIYQFTDFFLLDHRWNLVRFVTDVAEELLTYGRLMNMDKHVAFTQLQMYNKIPFKQSCCITAARLLADPNPRVAGAAGVYFETLSKDVNRRDQALTYCAEALEDGEEDLRIGACKALGILRGEEVREQLEFLAKCDTDKVKEAAEECLSCFVQGAHSSMSSDEKNVMIWNQTTVMSDMSLSTDF